VVTAALGPRSRPARTALSALGIAVGVAALVALIGIPATQAAQTAAELDAMGANLLVVYPGEDQRDHSTIPLPESAPAMLARVGPVTGMGVVRVIPEVNVYRTDLVPLGQSQGLRAGVGDGELLGTLKGDLEAGRWFEAGLSDLPTAVLGSRAAEKLGADLGHRVWAGQRWWAVIGILHPLGLASDLDSTVFLAPERARALYPEIPISAIYLASSPGKAEAVRGVTPATANPANPGGVAVSQLSAYAGAQEIISEVFTRLSLGLGAVALLVGGIGIANTMVVSVMERRGEIGLRRAIGARSGQIAVQFVSEAAIIGFLGGVAGVAMGIYGVFLYSAVTASVFAVPLWLLGAGPGLSVVIGALAGLYPSLKAARQPPTQALRTV
jgi:putative ABC transport system permease protein